MADDLLNIVEKEVLNNNSPDQIKQKLIDQGYLEKDVDKALESMTSKYGKSEHSKEKKLIKVLSAKEIFDRVGYGFVPHQFLNILFYITGASYLWLGIVNGARAILSIVLSSILQEYSKVRKVGTGIIRWSGYLFGFSFFGMAFATLIKSVPLFTLFLLLGGVGVVTHGDLFNNMIRGHIKREKMGRFLSKIGQWGVVLTAACIVFSGWLMDKFPVLGSETITFNGGAFPLYGYLISFEITAIAFILSGHMVALIKNNAKEAQEKAQGFLKKYMKDMRLHMSTFLNNGNLFLLILTGILLGLAQVLGNSYFGVYIYETFKNVGLGGFMNVAAIYAVAVVLALLGPWFTKKVHKHTGLAPTLVFGTLLVAMLPLTIAYNPNLLAIGGAAALSMIGASILGVSQGMLTRKLLHESERKVYFSVASMAGVIPFLIMIPLGSYYAQLQGLVPLFKILGILLAVVVAPLYIILVGMGSKKRL